MQECQEVKEAKIDSSNTDKHVMTMTKPPVPLTNYGNKKNTVCTLLYTVHVHYFWPVITGPLKDPRARWHSLIVLCFCFCFCSTFWLWWKWFWPLLFLTNQSGSKSRSNRLNIAPYWPSKSRWSVALLHHNTMPCIHILVLELSHIFHSLPPKIYSQQQSCGQKLILMKGGLKKK